MTAAELADFTRVEPRCRVCRSPGVRHFVNQRLDWVGTPIVKARGRTHVVTYADVWREVEATINKNRDRSNQITYSSLWVHARRHHDVAAVAAYQWRKMFADLVKSLGSSKVPTK